MPFGQKIEHLRAGDYETVGASTDNLLGLQVETAPPCWCEGTHQRVPHVHQPGEFPPPLGAQAEQQSDSRFVRTHDEIVAVV
jgi:hypothetical protein